MEYSALLCQCAVTLMNLYILKSMVKQMVFLALVIVKVSIGTKVVMPL